MFWPLLLVAVTLRQKVKVSCVLAIGADIGKTGLLVVPPVQLTPAAAVCVFQLAKSTKNRFCA